MNVRTLGLAMVAVGFSFPVYAGADTELAQSMQQTGHQAAASIRADMAVKPSAAQFDQVYAQIRALPRHDSVRFAATTTSSTLGDFESSQSEGEIVRGEFSGASIAASAMAAITPDVNEAKSTAQLLRMTFGIGLFGLSWNR